MTARMTAGLALVLVFGALLVAPGCGNGQDGGRDPADIHCQSDSDCTNSVAPFCENGICVNCRSSIYSRCPQGFACVDVTGSGSFACVEACDTPGDCTNGANACCGHGCVDLTTSSLHCGACGHRCDPWLVCVNGKCGCPPQIPDLCGQQCTNLKANIYSCGTCGKPCPIQPARSPACVAGVCQAGTCYTGYADCNGADFDGCETNVYFDDNNCGECGKVCPQGTRCMEQTCTP